jgi:hypothetical protein
MKIASREIEKIVEQMDEAIKCAQRELYRLEKKYADLAKNSATLDVARKFLSEYQTKKNEFVENFGEF